MSLHHSQAAEENVSEDAARQQLEAVLRSRAFANAPRLTSFLRHVVEKTLAGDDAPLKEYSIGVEVFDRGESFDPRTDTIVRVQARRLRKKLDEYYAEEGKADPLIIELPKGGYVPRFRPGARHSGATDAVVPITLREKVGDIPEPEPSTDAKSGLLPNRLQVTRLLWVSASLGFVMLAGVVNWIGKKPAGERNTPLALVPLTTYPGFESSPTFSPDGSQVAFAWNGKDLDNFDIYVLVVGEPEPVRLTTDPRSDYSPAWSPDGRRIAFLRELRSKSRAEVRLVSPLGGGERKVTEVTAPVHPAAPNEIPRKSLSWHPDGSGVVIADRDSPASPFRLLLVSVEDGRKRALTGPRGETVGDFFGTFSTNGARLAFSRSGSHALTSRVLTQRFSDSLKPLGAPKVLMQGTPRNPRTVVWTADQKDLLVSSYYFGSLWRVDAEKAGNPSKLLFAGELVVDHAVSHSRQRLAFSRFSSEQNIWRLEMPFPGGRGTTAAVLISSTGINSYPRYSPSGERIFFKSSRSGNRESYICDSEGSNIVKLPSFGIDIGISQWSPNGRFLAGDSASGDIWIRSADGREPRKIVDHPALDITPSWSRDGHWIYFSSKRSGILQVWKIPSEGGTAEQVTRHGGVYAEESADGRFLYYSKRVRPPNSLWRVPVSGGEETQVLESLSNYANFTVVKEGIYFIPEVEPGRYPLIRFLHFKTGKITTVKKLNRPVHTGLSASPDGRSLLYTQVDREGSDLMLVENFR